jgi:hypothetical protein
VVAAGDLVDRHRTPPPLVRFALGYEAGPPRTALLRHSMVRRGPPVPFAA